MVSRRRNPNLAAWLSVIPGLGQVYNGQFGKAVFFPVSTGLTLFTGIVVISSGDRLSAFHVGPIAALVIGLLAVITFMGLFVLGLAFWASAVVDARRSAAREVSDRGAPPVRWWLLRL